MYSPEKEIDRAVNNNDWVSAFATAVSYFEYYGATKSVVRNHRA
jgi:hypothetical protein